MKKVHSKRIFAAFVSLIMVFMLLLPMIIVAENPKTPAPKEPVEKIIYSSGNWHHDYSEIDNKLQLIMSYTGSREIDASMIENMIDIPFIKFNLKNKTLLRGVYLPFTYPLDKPMTQTVDLWLIDQKGNSYGPYETTPLRFGSVREVDMVKKEEGEGWIEVSPEGEPGKSVMMDNIFIAREEIVLPAGIYSLYTDDPYNLVRNAETGIEGAALIKGIDYSVWKKYKEKLLQWEIENNPDIAKKEDEVNISIQGNEDLAKYAEEPEKYQDVAKEAPKKKLPAVITLEKTTLIDEIGFNTYNGGEGAAPGVVTIADKAGNIYGQFKAYGRSLGEAPNGLWIAAPGIVLEAGEYILAASDDSVLTYDEEGYPDFYVIAACAGPKIFDFTGRYFADLNTYKTSTLAGPVNPPVSAFNLKQFELTVIDKGESLELIGKYEGMPFSQLCEVTERDENSLKAQFQFNIDLQNLPYKAKIGAIGLITIQNRVGLQPKLDLKGEAIYDRAASKEKGADFNTYSLEASGSLASKDLPAYVIAALGARNGSTGNIPGPANAAQAAAGMLFPPLVGVIANVLQTLLKPKEMKTKLSVDEQAMADANQSLGKGLYDEKEAKAWAMMGEALGNSDEPDDDPFSVGDNEKPGGADYVNPETYDSSYEGYEDKSEYYDENNYTNEDYGDIADQSEPSIPKEIEEVTLSEAERLEKERDEWLQNLKTSKESADPNDPRSKELHDEYENYIASLNDRIDALKAASKPPKERMTVQIDHTGRTAEIEYDPQTDSWTNVDTGGEFKMEWYTNFVAGTFDKTKAFTDMERYKGENRLTAFDKAMDKLVADEKERNRLLGQLQKIRNESYGITPPAEGVGDVHANIDKLINDLSNRSLSPDELRDRASRIAKVVTGRTTGRTLSEEQGKDIADREMCYTKAATVTVTEGWTDVITGRTWAGMAGRAMLAGLTGGASEYVMNPIEALMDIKEGIDSGESGTRATLKAMGKYVLGELGGEYMGEAWKRSGYSINPDLIKKASDLGNTPVSKLLGMGGKAGSKEAMEGVASKASKTMLGSADSKIGKTASDAAEYAKYKTGVNKQASVIDAKIRAGEQLSPDEIRKVLRDPSIPRELKNSHPDIQNAYQDSLEKSLYNPANKNTSRQLEADMLKDIQKEFGPDAKIKVEVDSVRTPGTKGSRINADNDITGKITITDAKGNTIVREIPSDKVGKIYNEEFAEASGMMKDGKFDVAKAKAEMPEGITITEANGKTRTIDWDQATKEQQLDAFAKKHNQEVTDIKSAEAAADFNALKNESGVSNVGQLKAGVSTAKLADPAGLAKMEQYKIDNYFNKGGIANQTEAYEQLAKMGKLTDDLTNAYQKLGYNAQSIPDNMSKAIDIVGNRNLSPGARTLELQKLGFDGPTDLANKLSGRIEGLQKLGALAPDKPVSDTLEKITAIIIRSHLDENK